MTNVTIECPRCGNENTVPVESMLVALAVDDQDPELAAIVALLCRDCDDLIDIPVVWTTLLTLVTEGATLLTGDEEEESVLPPHPEAPADGPAFAADDVLELHELLASDSWFATLITAGPRREPQTQPPSH